MKIVAGKLNGVYLRDIFENMPDDVECVWAAVAYVTSLDLLNICKRKSIPMKLYARLDSSNPVSLCVLKAFLEPDIKYECKLITQHYHPKIIKADNYGVYIGSANLTNEAWNSNNIECGVWIDDNELEDMGISLAVLDILDYIETISNPLTTELYVKLSKLSERSHLSEANNEDLQYYSKEVLPHIGNIFEGLNRIPKKKSSKEEQKIKFIDEWNNTLELLRKIADLVSQPQNLPSWCSNNAASGVIVDQFLHSYYYEIVREGRRARHVEFNLKNKSSPENALREAVSWWKSSDKAPHGEDVYINSHAPFLNSSLSNDSLRNMDVDTFSSMMSRVHAFRTLARQTPNEELELPEDTKLEIDERCDIVARWLWNKKNKQNHRITDIIRFVIYGGSIEDVPLRIWEVCNNPQKHLPRVGLSTIGEIVGWALPNRYPPRNNRTSKALYALGFSEVRLYGGN